MKTTYRKTALQRTAFHEAGHAAMFFTQGRKFRHVTIVADETKCSLGHVLHDALKNFHPDENDDWKTRKMLEEAILCSLAGPAAERIFAGRRNWRGAAGDLRYVTNVATCFVPDSEEASAFISWLWIRANNVVQAKWRMVEILAAALLEQKTLSYKEAQLALRDAVLRK